MKVNRLLLNNVDVVGVGWGGYASDADTPDMVTVVAPTNPVRPGGRRQGSRRRNGH
mgnify:CR=1 FL=1